ncbi:hypothetical protein Agabi119p4_1012 [Agaricus bisporus var. burnettii]|uniref:Anaphase-promoting complex subunit 11 n=1 Tax=Agaricus bisporus var. burnettii TaxID=192524 RepID=A0A8H7FBN4_AGABI|nr:hypothetical protein Agabi119p4_1012 [Agaricus bisporus var. burnettii]
MKVTIKHWHAVAQWRWDTGKSEPNSDDSEGDVCGDDCPLIWGECTHIFHMHCLLKWLGTAASKQQCPMDRRTWVTAERKVAESDTSTTTNSS